MRLVEFIVAYTKEMNLLKNILTVSGKGKEDFVDEKQRNNFLNEPQ